MKRLRELELRLIRAETVLIVALVLLMLGLAGYNVFYRNVLVPLQKHWAHSGPVVETAVEPDAAAEPEPDSPDAGDVYGDAEEGDEGEAGGFGGAFGKADEDEGDAGGFGGAFGKADEDEGDAQDEGDADETGGFGGAFGSADEATDDDEDDEGDAGGFEGAFGEADEADEADEDEDEAGGFGGAFGKADEAEKADGDEAGGFGGAFGKADEDGDEGFGGAFGQVDEEEEDDEEEDDDDDPFASLPEIDRGADDPLIDEGPKGGPPPPGSFAAWAVDFIDAIKLDWIDIFLRQLVIIVAFLGAMLATRRRKHINIDALSRVLPTSAVRWVSMGTNLLAIVVCLVLAGAGLELVKISRAHPKELMPWADEWTFQLMFPIGFSLLALHFIVRLLEVASGHVPEDEPGPAAVPPDPPPDEASEDEGENADEGDEEVPS
jgi:TRAP-type C4-dicarboxylate transport system permease small subunit